MISKWLILLLIEVDRKFNQNPPHDLLTPNPPKTYPKKGSIGNVLLLSRREICLFLASGLGSTLYFYDFIRASQNLDKIVDLAAVTKRWLQMPLRAGRSSPWEPLPCGKKPGIV